MSDQHPTAKPLLERLADVGDPRTSWKWAHGKMDYVAQLGLSPADIPELISIARQWVDRTDWPDDDRDMTVYAPVHAWRALAHLHAVDAIPALLEMTVIMDERDDDWHMEEFPNVFALIGPASFDPLVAVLSDRHQRLYVRATAATALRKLAERHPQTRPQVVGALRAALADSQANDPGVNGLIISNLMNLNATEAAPEIERAFAADQVDLMVTGNWNTVRQEMGLEDTGLVPPELASRRPTSAIPNLDAFLAARQAMQSRLDAPIAQPVRPTAKVGRNDPCPCGSGKKHKKCCGR